MKNTAQNLSEYTLAIGLICLVTIGALATLGNTLNQGLSETMSFQEPITPAGNPTLVGLGTQGSGQPNTPGSSNLTITNPDGSQFQLTGMPIDAALSVETVGSDGTLIKYAQVLQSLSNELETTQQIDPDTASLIRQLANLGFTQANNISKLKNKSSTSPQVPPAVIHGVGGNFGEGGVNIVETRLNQLNQYLENPNASKSKAQEIQKNIQFPETVRAMVGIYEQLKDKSILQEPAIKKIIDNALGNITAISIRSGQAVLLRNEGKATSIDTFVAKNVKTTQNESGKICTTNQNNETNGIRCNQKS